MAGEDVHEEELYRMHGFGPRVIEPEILETVGPDRAARSLADLRRINRLTGGHWILRKLLREVVPQGDRFSFLDVGSATGDMGEVVRRAYPNAQVISLDLRHHHVASAPRPGVQADAFVLPFADRSVDIVFCSLFLHHFSNEEVTRLLREFSRVARRGVIAIDLVRSPVAWWFLPATGWLLGWDSITLNDGPISVQAAWRRHELAQLAERAGLHANVRSHGLSYRLSLVAKLSSPDDRAVIR
jgi:SAM-dependent methyltransferase